MSEAGNEAKRPARRCDECCRAVATTEVVAEEYVADRREPGGLASGGLLGDQGERLRQFFYAALDARVDSGTHLGPLLHGILDAPRRDGQWIEVSELQHGDFDPLPVASRGIEDPVEQGPEVCARVYARVERCIEELAQALALIAQQPAGR